MIVEAQKHDRQQIIDILSRDICQNPYLYIDILSFGISGDNIFTWKIIQGQNIVGVIYKYYNSLQLFVDSSTLSRADCNDIAQLIINGDYQMITGRADAIRDLQSILTDSYSSYYGMIMTFNHTIHEPLNNHVVMASIDDLYGAAKLVCSDKNIGGHYTVEQLSNQFYERMLNHDCINLVYKDEDEIVCHAGTYASVGCYAIIGGIITSSSHRGKGLARETTLKLIKLLQSQNKLPIIFCYEPNLFDWYAKLGFEVKTNCGKLEKIR